MKNICLLLLLFMGGCEVAEKPKEKFRILERVVVSAEHVGEGKTVELELPVDCVIQVLAEEVKGKTESKHLAER